MGILYLVATPIGNLEDLTMRAVRILSEATLIAAEDTRSARKLLTHLKISKPITSYFEHNKLTKLNSILDALDAGDVAVISDAGMPGLSDPGYELVCAALARGIRVEPIPGPSAITSALVASGLPTDQFMYLGFLPRQKSARRKFLQEVVVETRTLVLFEAPHRVVASLSDIADVLGNRPMCVARELTKIHEEFLRGSVSELQKHFVAHPPRGEFTLVIAGKTTDDRQQTTDNKAAWDDATIIAAVRDLIAAGVSRTDAVKRIARASGRDRREVYRLAMSS